MKLLGVTAIVAVVLGVILVPNVSAHSPIGSSDNESLATATMISDPLKSWAIYSELHTGGEAQYYRFDMAADQRIFLQLLKPTTEKFAAFLPGMLLMGPGIVSVGTIPDYVETVQGYGAAVYNGTMPAQASFEPFSPSAFYELAKVSMDAPETGTYYVAVFEPTSGGNYGLAVGERESFTIGEWLLTPFSLLTVYQWEGQDLFVILVPLISIVVFGFILLLRRHMKGNKLDVPGWMGSLAGLFILGGGITVFSQVAFALTMAPVDPTIAVTVIFGTIPIILGLGMIRMALVHSCRWDRKARIYLVVVGLVALFMWSGYLVGPVLAFAASAMPSEIQLQTRRSAET